MKDLKKASLVSILIAIVLALSVASAVHALALFGSITAVGSPSSIAYDSGKGEIYVVNSYPNTSGYGTVSVISDSNNTVLESITVGGYPIYAAYDSAKGEIFVTNSQDNFISVISDSTHAVVASVTFPFNEAYGSWGIAYDSADGQVFVATQRGTVYVLSDSLNALVETAPLGSNFNSHCIAYDVAKKEMFVTNNGNGTVSVLSVSPITSHPTALGLSSLGLILVVVAVVVVTLCAVALAVRKSARTRSDSKQ
jgi:YVTN family beta-propeller protein